MAWFAGARLLARAVAGRARESGVSGPLGTVIIPAHNEAAVVRRCLGALFDGVQEGELDVLVACNGCTDGTAELARSSGYPVRVLDLVQVSKTAALRAGDQAALSYPRLYLDADVVLHGDAARGVLRRLRSGAIAARPPIEYDTRHSSFAVRSYFRARSLIPAVHRSLWGAGVYGLSEAGRARFEAFPDLVGDDLWVDRHFDSDEVEIVRCPPVRVLAPRHARDLVRVLQRTYRVKAEQPPEARPEGARATTTSTLGDLVRLFRHGPLPALDAAIYAAFAVTGRFSLMLPGHDRRPWERDESSRVS